MEHESRRTNDATAKRHAELEQRGRLDQARVRVALLRARLVDSMMGLLIAVGGVSTIIALLLVVMVLVFTVLPLLRPVNLGVWEQVPIPDYDHVGIDGRMSLLWGVREGELEVRSLRDGKVVDSRSISIPSSVQTCSFMSSESGSIAYGFEDGTVQLVTVVFEGEQPSGVARKKDAANARRSTQLRELAIEQYELSELPVVALDHLATSSTGPFVESEPASFVAVCGTGPGQAELVVATFRQPVSLLADPSDYDIEFKKTAIRARTEDARPMAVMAMAGLRHVLVLWPDGSLDRYSVQNDGLDFRESCSIVVGSERITSVARMYGRQTLLCGTDQGRVVSCTLSNYSETKFAGGSGEGDAPMFGTSDPLTAVGSPRGDDGFRLRVSHQIQVSENPICCLNSSGSSHHFLAADTRGNVSLYFATTENLLATSSLNAGREDVGKIEYMLFGPGDEALLAQTQTHVLRSRLDVGNSDASWSAYFEPIWYEGHDELKYIWQPAYGSETSQAKLSLIPLFFGTLKATLVSMFFAVPLAMLAAIYSSEFLTNSVRSVIKPIIELMASVPGVVLGYIVAIIVAPVLRERILALLVAVVCIPIVYLLFGRLWAIVVKQSHHPKSPTTEFWLLLLTLPIAGMVSIGVAGLMEQWWFMGDFAEWINSGRGHAFGGWALLLFPLVILLCIYALVPRINRLCNQVPPGTKRHFARAVAILVVPVFSLVVAVLLALSFQSAGWDLRESLLTSFQERNAVVVGFALTFCSVPLIFTMADDALRAVPAQQRSASIACGASSWQTAMRIVIPSALSGLVSSVVVGAGRVVGETMIVLMVVGNTPLMEWNPFSGLRALTATLATELPEAAKGSTHYRTLFLAALMLFVFTLAANTLAEYVRLRGRKRVSQL